MSRGWLGWQDSNNLIYLTILGLRRFHIDFHAVLGMDCKSLHQQCITYLPHIDCQIFAQLFQLVLIGDHLLLQVVNESLIFGVSDLDAYLTYGLPSLAQPAYEPFQFLLDVSSLGLL